MNSNTVQTTDATFYIIFGISLFLLAVVTVLMFYFIYKYNHKRNPVATDITGNTSLEILWTVIPTILALIMFFIGYAGFKQLRNVPEDALNIKVIGRMWAWSYEYPNGLKSDTLKVPEGKSIRLELTSTDVNHSFFIPAFRIKEDAIPGRKNYLWFEPKEKGQYQVECAEYCGLSHAYMLSKIHVIPEPEYIAWYNAYKSPSSQDSLKQNMDTLKTANAPNPEKDSLKVKTDTTKK